MIPPEATSHPFDILAWDSRFFGFGVARITAPWIPLDLLPSVLGTLRAQGIALAYWATDPVDSAMQEAALGNGGVLVDGKVTYVARLEGLTDGPDTAPVAGVEEYKDGAVDPALYRLSLQSGEYSRFSVDPRFPREIFENLYREWVRKSVTRELARAVLVFRERGTIQGLATVGEKDRRGDIGLVAVDRTARGRGIGTALIAEAARWFVRHGYRAAQVVTQRANQGACRLYQRCGYSVEKIENVYHFWL